MVSKQGLVNRLLSKVVDLIAQVLRCQSGNLSRFFEGCTCFSSQVMKEESCPNTMICQFVIGMPDQLSLEGRMRQVLRESRAWRKQLKIVSDFVPEKKPALTVLREGFKYHSDSLLTFLRMQIIIFLKMRLLTSLRIGVLIYFENETLGYLRPRIILLWRGTSCIFENKDTIISESEIFEIFENSGTVIRSTFA